MEHLSQEFEIVVGVAQAIAVCNVKFLTIKLGGERLSMHNQSTLLL